MRKDIGQRIKKYRKLSGLSQIDLAEKIGVTNRAVSNWESGTNGVDVELIPQICAVLNISPNDLLHTSDTEPLSAESLSIAKKFESLDDHGKTLVTNVLDLEYERCKSVKPSVVRLCRFSSPAAAGSPNYADSDSEWMEYDSRFVPDDAKYAVGISGHSMEPDLPDGCTVFVSVTERIADGDIVIAWLEGSGTVCKRAVMDGERIVKLESINRAYEDYCGHDLQNLRIFGRVVGSL